MKTPYAPLDGMNEKGLAIGVLVIEDGKVHQNTGKVPITTTYSEHKTRIALIVDGFLNGAYLRNVATIFCRDLYTVLWTLCLIIPGIVKSYEYKMIPYILAENPRISRKRAFEISKNMMDGEKWNAFVLDLSFIGWNLLSTITFGIVGVLYVNPYVNTTWAEFYKVMRENALETGNATREELIGLRKEADI